MFAVNCSDSTLRFQSIGVLSCLLSRLVATHAYTVLREAFRVASSASWHEALIRIARNVLLVNDERADALCSSLLALGVMESAVSTCANADYRLAAADHSGSTLALLAWFGLLRRQVCRIDRSSLRDATLLDTVTTLTNSFRQSHWRQLKRDIDQLKVFFFGSTMRCAIFSHSHMSA
jgi:hypothetical protein